MMKLEETKAMENSTYGAEYGNLCSMSDGVDGVGSGFLEMLGVQEFQIPTMGYMFEEMVHRELMSSLQMQQSSTNHVCNNEYLKMMINDGVSKQFEDNNGSNNAPGTPNSNSSISLASNNEGVVVESEQEKDEEQGHEGSGQSMKQQLKAKKTKLKKQRQPRFAFMTKSEVDHLEDGYRWRKYGQKAVKNSPFPRNYYRCTYASCGVKKRVERSCTDPSIVVTTYEGQHIHSSPLTPRGISSAIFRDSAAFAAMPTLMQMDHLHSRYQQPPSSYFALPLNYHHNNYSYHTATAAASPYNFTSFTHSPPTNVNYLGYNNNNPNQGFLRDHGLLQDLIPSLVPKEE
ncbi:unnamed protein product [Rhodiola kirilowii]